jgi:hypothetical protein
MKKLCHFYEDVALFTKHLIAEQLITGTVHLVVTEKTQAQFTANKFKFEIILLAFVWNNL